MRNGSPEETGGIPAVHSAGFDFSFPRRVRHIRIIHKLRTLVALLLFAAMISAAGCLWWVNRTGLPDTWRTKIEQALASQGLHADIGKLRYWPLRGIEADEIRVYADESRQRVIARAKEVVVSVDRSKLARGEVRVERLELIGGSLALPADPDDPESKVLEVSNASGRVLMPGGRRLEILDARGDIGGIRLEFEAFLLGYRQRLSVKDMDNEEAQIYRRKLLSRVIGLLEPWSFEPAKPPVIRIRLEGDLDDPKSVRADLSLKSDGMERGGIALTRVEAAGEMRGRLLVLESLDVEDGGGALKGRMEYDLATRSGHFDARSNLELPALLKEVNAAGILDKVSFQSRPEITARGNFEWPEDAPPDFHLIGHLAASDVKFADHSASRLESDISWDGERLYLDNVVATRPDGHLNARLLVEPDQVRYEVSTNLRVSVWRGLFEGQTLGRIFSDFSENDNPAVSGRVEGRFNRHDKHDWSTVGEVRAENMSYKGTPFLWATTRMMLNHDFLDFHDGSVEFDYSGYAMRKAHGGPMSGKASAASVRWESGPGTLVFEDVKGSIWPAPVLRMFLPQVADHLEQYRFHQPPKLEAEGVIGLFKRGSPKTDFRVKGSTPGEVSYKFADTDLRLSDLATEVRVLPGHTEVNDLSFSLYEGPVRGKFDVRYDGDDVVKGELDWTRLSLPEISKDCGFDKVAKGFVTGRIELEQRGKGPAGLDAEGLVALEEGELFSVPIFGPLSPVLSAVLANRKAGFQEAKEAFCTFKVKDGVLRTNDFETATPSLVFTGDAVADLNRKTLDMTLRMNARGLLGVITLPLKPFYGLFQFRGAGPLREPKWDNVMFTSPPEDEQEKLTAPPKARSVGRPPGRP